MKKIIKSMDKDFPPIVFGCDFCGAEFVVNPPEEDMNIHIVSYPVCEYGLYKEYVVTTYYTHCPICGEKVFWKVCEEKESLDD